MWRTYAGVRQNEIKGLGSRAMIDRGTKLLLAAIALGLWVNAIGNWFQPVAVEAQSERYLRNIQSSLRSIESDVSFMSVGVLGTGSVESDVSAIANGLCINNRIC